MRVRRANSLPRPARSRIAGEGALLFGGETTHATADEGLRVAVPHDGVLGTVPQMPLRFTWDPDKERRNVAKHGLTFREAGSVFGDAFSTTFPDPAHSRGEQRYVTIGLSDRGNVLVVAHADREDSVRIISARRATRSERRFYEEG